MWRWSTSWRAAARGGSDSETINYVVETAFKKLKEDLTGDTLSARCLVEKVVELLFKHAIGVFSLLLFAKLDTVFRSFSSLVESVLARG